MLTPGDVLDGYRLLRPIGAGGFGEVWLCRSEAIGDLRALKLLRSDRRDALDREHAALVRYRKAVLQSASPHLLRIEHVNLTDAGLFYVMPLADGYGADSPESADWHPLTLAAAIRQRRDEPAWFSCAEIAATMTPVLDALQALSEAELVHRDVKPDNILFLNGTPVLGDISLLDDDATALTRRGTPGYATPSWFIGGHPDMYGAAATLYTFLTGNAPDKMGRATFRQPPQGEAAIPKAESAEYRRLHAVVRRAIDERASERFPDFRAFADSLSPLTATSVNRGRWIGGAIGILAAVIIVGGIIATTLGTPKSSPAAQAEPVAKKGGPSIAPVMISQAVEDSSEAAIFQKKTLDKVKELRAALDDWNAKNSNDGLPPKYVPKKTDGLTGEEKRKVQDENLKQWSANLAARSNASVDRLFGFGEAHGAEFEKLLRDIRDKRETLPSAWSVSGDADQSSRNRAWGKAMRAELKLIEAGTRDGRILYPTTQMRDMMPLPVE